MPAVMRAPPSRPPAGKAAPSRGKPEAGAKSGKPSAGKRRAAYAPGKLNGTGRVDLHPGLALAAAAAVLLAGLGLTLATGGRGKALGAGVVERTATLSARMGFRVAHVQVQGASSFAQPYILRAAGLAEGQPILALDLAQVRARVEQVGYIKSARVERLLPDSLRLSVTERPRLAVWQRQGRATVVDDHGQVIADADPGLFPDLPLIVGEGAPEAAAAVLPLVQARPRLMERLEALVRVDARRWDVRLKDSSLIQLPASGEDAALIQLDQLDQRSRVLELGFDRIDLRDPDMVMVRPRQSASATAIAAGQARPAPAAGR